MVGTRLLRLRRTEGEAGSSTLTGSIWVVAMVVVVVVSSEKGMRKRGALRVQKKIVWAYSAVRYQGRKAGR